MGFSFNANNSKRIVNYAQAKAVFDSITPVRRRSPECRPFGDRRTTWYHIKELRDCEWSKAHPTAPPPIAINYYNTNVITFYPDGEVELNNGTWASQSNFAIYQAVLGMQVCVKNKIIWVSACTTGSSEKGMYQMRKDGGNMFVMESNGYPPKWRYLNPAYPMVHILKKEKMTELRKKYREFDKYFMGMVKLRGGLEITDEEWSATLENPTETLGDPSTPIATDADKFYMTMLRTLVIFKYNHKLKVRSWWLRNNEEYGEKRLYLKDARVALNDYIKTVHAHEVFHAHEVRSGKVVKDSNEKYFSFRC